LYEDTHSHVWVGAMYDLWEWKPGPPKRYTMPDATERVYGINETEDGAILVVQRSGISKLKNGNIEPYALAVGVPFLPHRILRDRNGALWIGAIIDKGLLHIHQGRVDLFSPVDGLAGHAVTAFLEDREGTIWVATIDGLNRFRDFAIPKFSDQQSLSSRGVAAVVAAKDGSVWIATSEGVNQWNAGRTAIFRRGDGLPANKAEVLFEDAQARIWVGTQSGVAFRDVGRWVTIPPLPLGLVYGFADGSGGAVWLSHQEALFQFDGARVVQRIAWTDLQRNEPAISLLHDPARGGLWLGFRDGGVAYFSDGKIQHSYGKGEGVGDGMVRDLFIDQAGTLWAATEGGVSRMTDGRFLTLTNRNGLPCDGVHWIREDNRGSVWMYLACGLVRVDAAALHAWAASPAQTIHATLFDRSDGVTGHRYSAGYNSVVSKAPDGRLWFAPTGGLSIIDPEHLSGNSLPPPVHIEAVVADGKQYPIESEVRLPPRIRDLRIDYTALSLVVPDKNQFRIKLDGRDQDWQDVGTRRQAFYTDLGPGQYRFRVIASNDRGVWNETGAAIVFAVAPAYYQTAWFKAAVIVTALATLWILYLARVRHVARDYQHRLDERVNERTRIARELHDTLLQSFHGLLLQFQTAAYLLPERPAEARVELDGAIVHAARAITEGRDAVQGLRASTVEGNDLANAIRTLGDTLGTSATAPKPPEFSVAVEGETRDLHPIGRDEIYKIAAEALRNAFQHAYAGRVEVEIRYDDEQFRLRVRDDGKGIDPKVLADRGLDGHYGLRGMSERAGLTGGSLAVWSEVGAGTEVELRLPASIVYVTSARRSWWQRISASKTSVHEGHNS
jgi:signal transduction histidine kinase/ligand-binding sensor domain-containing protein